MVEQTLPTTRQNKTARLAAFVYGLVCYALSVATLLYLCGFVGNFGVFRSIDSVPTISWDKALVIDAALIGIFSLQHSAMARPGFKTWWTQFVPKPLERSTYLLCTNLCLGILFYFWQPIGGTIWQVTNTTGVAILYALFASGWLLLLVSTVYINHFDLFGLRQVWFYLHGKEYTPLNFATPGVYNYVRHPIYVGLLLAFWFAPTMTVTHLVFALMTTAYILIAIQFEERDLINVFGKKYADYRRRVPMLVPFTRQHEP
jgi:methanethiol S-methyltransferase